jgi:dihydrolipoamide dehydrogenase
MVGRTESRARADGYNVRTVEYDIGEVSGAEVRGVGYTGRAKVVVDEARRVLLGATFVAPDADSLMHSATVAVNAEVPLDQLWHAVPPFPTVSEVWLFLLEAYGL